MIIDIFCHYLAKSVLPLLESSKIYGDGKQVPYSLKNSDPEFRLSHMDKYKIDVQAICQTTPVLLGFNAEDAAEICRRSNSENWELCKSYPDRFVNICVISLLDMKSAMKELERSISELDCRGITVSSNQNGRGLDDSEYLPFYDKLAAHDLPLFIQPTHWESYPLVDMDKGWRMMQTFGWPFDTTQAVWRLIFGGIIDRYPSLKIVTHHMGGMIPYYTGRVESCFIRYLRDKVPRHISEYWGNIYGDTAMDGTVDAFPCGYAFFGADRLMYGSDYPFGTEAGEFHIRENLEGVRALKITAADMEKVLGGNAKKLLKIKG